MLKSLWNGVNGVKTQNLGVDITANNISNVNTIGFKRTSSEFADIFYQRVVSRSANPAEIGSGSLLSAKFRLHSAWSYGKVLVGVIDGKATCNQIICAVQPSHSLRYSVAKLSRH